MSEELKPCPFCGDTEELTIVRINDSTEYWWVGCETCDYNRFILGTKEEAVKTWNTRPIEDEKDKEIESLKVELDNLQHFCDSILEMAKRNNGVLYFRQNSGTWKIETGKDIDVPANAADNNVGSIK